MSSFTTPLDLRYQDGRNWEVLSSFDYCVGSLESCQLVRVPRGFVTDFASIPRFFWRLLPPTGTYGKAAVLHDFIYRTAGHPYSRLEADNLFIEAMAVLGVSSVIRWTMWLAVRLFGKRAYTPRGADMKGSSV